MNGTIVALSVLISLPVLQSCAPSRIPIDPEVRAALRKEGPIPSVCYQSDYFIAAANDQERAEVRSFCLVLTTRAAGSARRSRLQRVVLI